MLNNLLLLLLERCYFYVEKKYFDSLLKVVLWLSGRDRGIFFVCFLSNPMTNFKKNQSKFFCQFFEFKNKNKNTPYTFFVFFKG